MPFWVEEVTDRLRAAVGCLDFPGWEGTLALAIYLGATVRLQYLPITGHAWCRHWWDGTTTIWVPEGDTVRLAHELGHAVLSNGLAGVVQFSNPPLARLQQAHEEAVACRFSRAWLLPKALCRGNLLTIYEESGVPIEILRQRMHDLGG